MEQTVVYGFARLIGFVAIPMVILFFLVFFCEYTKTGKHFIDWAMSVLKF